jgi:rare lipoprotein A
MRQSHRPILLLCFLGCLACASQGRGGRVLAVVPTPEPAREMPFVSEGRASYYARSLAGHKTASGEPYDPERLTAAHHSLPLGTIIRVTRLPDGPSVEVRVNDRCGCQHGHIIDLSESAARKLNMLRLGTVPVGIAVLGR